MSNNDNSQRTVWRRMGTDVSHCTTAAEAMEFTGMDFTVVKRKMTIKYEDSDGDSDYGHQDLPECIVRNNWCTMRTDTKKDLGVVGKKYQIIQNNEAFSFFDAIVAEGIGVKYETAGALGGGERVFLTATLPDYIAVGNHDLIKKYLFLTNSHDRFGSLIAGFTPQRIYCENTLNAAIRGCTNALKIRHTSNALEKLKEAHHLMGLVNERSTQLGEKFNHWAKVRITSPELKRLITLAMIPNKELLKKIQQGGTDQLSTMLLNTVEKVHEYAIGSPTQQYDTTAGTVFGAYNGVTGYFQNVVRYNKDEAKNDEAKFKSILLGGNAQSKAQRTFDLCEQFASTGELPILLN